MKKNYLNLDLYKISVIIITLYYLNDIFEISQFKNLIEFLIIILTVKIISKVKTPFFLIIIYLLIFVNSIIFAVGPYFHYYSIITNLRDWLLPVSLFYIGYYYSRSDDDKRLSRFLIFLLIISLPLSIFGQTYYFKKFVLFDLYYAGDPIGGIFGVQGGSGIFGMFLTLTIFYLYLESKYHKTRRRYFNLYIMLYLIMVVYSESKIALYLIILLSVIILLMNIKLRRSSFIIPVFSVLIVILFINMYSIFYPQINYSFFSTKFVDSYLTLDEAKRGYWATERAGVGGGGIEATRLTRSGAFYFAYYHISKDPIHFLFGYGPGSAQFSARYKSVVSQFGYELLRLDFLAAPSILFEYGFIGLAVWLAILFYFFLSIYKKIVKNLATGIPPDRILLFLFLFIPILVISLVYNWAFFRINFGGIFFLFLGAAYNRIFNMAQGHSQISENEFKE